MQKKFLRAAAFLCTGALIMGVVSGCASADGSSGTAAEEDSKTLADHVEEQVTGMVLGLEKRGATVAEIAEKSAAAGYLAELVLEYRGFICVPQAEGADGFAYMYDNAAAVIALTHAGADWYALKIADAIVYAMDHDRTFNDGRLRNAYLGGDPGGNTGWSFAGGEGTVKLAGLWEEEQWREDYYAVSTSTSNMAWIILALCCASQSAPGEKAAEYLAAAEKAAGFVLGLRSESGGFTGGYEGWDDSQVRAAYKSTEHNIDLVAAFSTLAALVDGQNPAGAEEYAAAAEHARAFVLSMYDGEGGYFYTGTHDDGVTVSAGVLPLDANTWAVLTLGDSFAEAPRVMAFVEGNMAVGDGFDFSAGDLDGIWNEGTAQMAVCYRTLGNAEAYERVMAYLATQTAEDGSITAADRDGVSTGFFVSGTDVLWEYNCTTNLGATNWLAFAQLGKSAAMPPGRRARPGGTGGRRLRPGGGLETAPQKIAICDRIFCATFPVSYREKSGRALRSQFLAALCQGARRAGRSTSNCTPAGRRGFFRGTTTYETHRPCFQRRHTPHIR